MLKLLFIEDDQKAIEPVLRLIKKEKKNVCCEVSEFGTAKERIASFHPDIVILDLLFGGASPEEGEPEGLKTREFIWQQHFCPIVVFSARPEVYDDEFKPHPFEKSIKKGTGSPQKVLDAICEFLPHVDALKEAERYIRHSFSCAMRDVAPYAFEVLPDDPTQRNDMIKRSGRRRLAARMDEISGDETRLAGWEQYLYPPICEDIRLGDILKKENAANDDFALFRVVLTPSCDLVSSGSRSSKVHNVLVAKCCSMNDGLDLINWKNIGNGKLKERLPDILTQGYFKTVIPFPGLKNRIPTMAVNLRDLELIPIEDISDSDGAFCRIASVDSPFRELIAWAYQQTACRPGLPDRDIDSWSREIIETRGNKGSGKQT